MSKSHIKRIGEEDPCAVTGIGIVSWRARQALPWKIWSRSRSPKRVTGEWRNWLSPRIFCLHVGGFLCSFSFVVCFKTQIHSDASHLQLFFKHMLSESFQKDDNCAKKMLMNLFVATETLQEAIHAFNRHKAVASDRTPSNHALLLRNVKYPTHNTAKWVD